MTYLCGFPWQEVCIELFLFLVSELLVRVMISDFKISNHQRHLLIVQCILLINFSLLVYAFHHFPLVLVVCTIAVLLRLLVKVYGTHPNGLPALAISKPLKHIKSDGNVWRDLYNYDYLRQRRPLQPAEQPSFSPPPSFTPLSSSFTACPPSSFSPPLSSSFSPPLSSSFTPSRFIQNKNSQYHCRQPTPPPKPQPRSSSAICHPPTINTSLLYDTTGANYNVNCSPFNVPVKINTSLQEGSSSRRGDPYCIPKTISVSTTRPIPFQGPLIGGGDNKSHSLGGVKYPPGIINTGNICFMISVIHCLAGLEDFIRLLSTFPPLPSGQQNYSNLVSSLQNLIIEQCQNWNLTSINPKALLTALSSLAPHLVSASKQSQQDAAEFLLWLLDTLHEVHNGTIPFSQERNDKICQLRREKEAIMNCLQDIDSNNVPSYCDDLKELSQVDYKLLQLQNMSPVYQMCCGQILEARECQECRKVSVNIEYYTILTVPVPIAGQQAYRIQDCFNLFGQIENLTQSNNMLRCTCTLQGAGTPGKRLALLNYMPSNLVIQLSRFSYDTYTSQAIKNQSTVLFPVTGLNLYPFTMESKLGYPDTSKLPLYDLTGFCVHTGARTTSYGHYVAYCKVKDGSWYRFDDDIVTLINNIEREIEQPHISQNAYLLFYTAKS